MLLGSQPQLGRQRWAISARGMGSRRSAPSLSASCTTQAGQNSAVTCHPYLSAYVCVSCVHQVGWKHQDAVAELEAKRKAKASKFYEAKKKSLALRAKAAAQVAA